jgi:hypothetical protein
VTKTSQDDELYEAWLDVWCVVWHHIGLWHEFTTVCGPAVWIQEWYQRGVFMGIVATDYRIEAVRPPKSEGEP